MTLSEKERELYQITRSGKLNVIRDKTLAEKGRIQWLPESTESERFHLEIQRRKQFLEETLGAYVESLIETLQKVEKNVDDNDFKEIVEELKLIVETTVKNFSDDYKNNIFLGLPKSIIDSTIFVLKNELPSLIPTALIPLSKFKVENELLNKRPKLDDYENALEIIRTAMISQNQTPVYLAKHDEDSYRKIIGNALRIIYKGQVTFESLNKSGKTDILLKINNKNVLIAECRIWTKDEDFKGAIKQLIDRYLEWRDDKAVLIIFCRNNSLTNVLSKIKTITENWNNHKQTLKSEEENEFRFLFSHPEDNNRNLTLSVMTFKIPKNQNNNAANSKTL